MNRRRLAPTLLQAWLLAGLLLAAQALGLAHRVAHGGGSATVVSATSFTANHEAGSADCRLVDQLTQADLLCASPPAGAPTLPAYVERTLFTLPAWAAQPAAAYLARAPPRG
jgi:hypothetical protein